MKLQWKGDDDVSDLYAGIITRRASQEFYQTETIGHPDTLEAVMLAFFASKQYRIGPLPNPESQVKMRQIVRHALLDERPIPVLIPSAAIKVPSMDGSIDLAEMAMLRTLDCLNKRIKLYHKPGLNIRIRMEDMTEFSISVVPDFDVQAATSEYIDNLHDLIKVMDMDDFIVLKPESVMADWHDWHAAVAETYPLFMDALAGNRVHIPYWDKPSSPLLVQFLKDRYATLYPNLDPIAYDVKVSTYLSTIVARRMTNATGGWPSGQMEISFAKPLPDAPEVSTRILYRTLPSYESTMHKPYWAGVGRLWINEQAGTSKISMSHVHPAAIHKGTITLTNGDTDVTVGADYVLE